MKKQLSAIAGILVTTLAAFPAGAFADSSVPSSRPVSWGPPPGAKCSVGRDVNSCFEKRGDKFWIRDKAADGHHVDVAWAVDTSRGWDGVCHNYHGKSAGWTVCDGNAKDIPEHDTIWFRSIVAEGDNWVWEGGNGPNTTSPTT